VTRAYGLCHALGVSAGTDSPTRPTQEEVTLVKPGDVEYLLDFTAQAVCYWLADQGAKVQCRLPWMSQSSALHVTATDCSVVRRGRVVSSSWSLI
jgi:hypothetical protein